MLDHQQTQLHMDEIKSPMRLTMLQRPQRALSFDRLQKPEQFEKQRKALSYRERTFLGSKIEDDISEEDLDLIEGIPDIEYETTPMKELQLLSESQ